ncbi:MAG: NADH:flavin oxidoreductase [Betaproteobacteria bacterium]|nr:NADH:flavin oxidoreductase [Betaproteobacteria bacterium]
MKLFEPLNIGSMLVPNRVMVPAMVTHLCKEDGVVTQDTVERYVRYASGGAGLIIVEAMAVHQVKSGPLLRISDDRYVPGLRELARKVHDASDSKLVPQIIHFLKVARSGWRQTADMLSVAEIDQIVEQFGDAVRRAREAGFDGAELHSAHAYTLSSFLSRANPRTDEYGGQTLEGRLRLIGRVMESVRRKAGADFPVGIRFNVEEFIKNGYTVVDSKRIALRLAELGAAYLSLSAGGKFEDAVHTPGQVLYPYNGYSGDRCMPGDWLPRALHADLAAEVKRHLIENGHRIPVGVAGKLSDPHDAERLLAEGKADLVGIARGLLADPDWPNKVRRGELERIVQCDYCNVCKALDGTHRTVICALWPQGTIQAPADNPAIQVPQWTPSAAGLTAIARESRVELKWPKAAGASHYEVYRAEARGHAELIDAVKVAFWVDNAVLGGHRYTYHVRPCAASGRPGPRSATVGVDVPAPSYLNR